MLCTLTYAFDSLNLCQVMSGIQRCDLIVDFQQHDLQFSWDNCSLLGDQVTAGDSPDKVSVRLRIHRIDLYVIHWLARG